MSRLEEAIADLPTPGLQVRRLECAVLQSVWNYVRHRDADRHETATSCIDDVYKDAVQLFDLRMQMMKKNDYAEQLHALEDELERRTS